jgi:uncharacterized protein (TIGR03437 family)
LTATPNTVTLNAPVGGGTASQTVTLSYQTYTQGAPSFSTAISTNQGLGWISVSPATGTMTQASYAGFQYTYTATVTVTVNSMDISSGNTYTGTVSYNAAGGVAQTAVTMNVTAQPARFTVSPQSLSFTYTQGAPGVPAAQSVAVSSAPSGATFSASASAAWLATTPSSGTSPASVSVSVNPGSLAPGTYSGTVSLSSAGMAAATVPVTLTVAPANAPQITQGGVVPVYSSAQAVQSGSWISIYGTHLAPATATWNGDFPTSLGGVSVTVDNKPAYLWFVSPAQINLQVPDDTATGSVNVVFTTSVGSTTATVTLAPASPSFSLLDGNHVAGVIPTADGSGSSGGGTYDLLGPTGAFSYPTRPVKVGENLVLFGVGFGATNPAVPAGRVFSGAAPTVNPVRITVGGVQAQVSFAGLTSAGLYQFNVLVPQVASGDQPLQAVVNGVQTQAGPVVTVQ